MKKGLVLLGMVLILSGCGNKVVVCERKDESLPYKYNRTVEVKFEGKEIYSFKSTIVEEHPDENSANNSYTVYQNLYNNYNENSVISEYKKDKLKITAIYNIDFKDIENKKIEFEFDFTKKKNDFLNDLKDKGFSCN